MRLLETRSAQRDDSIMDEGNVSRGRFVPSSAAQLASLFHADEDYSSDSDQEHAYSHNHRGRDDALRGGSTQRIDSSSPASQAANILSAAAALRGSFPSPPGGRGAKGDDEELAQPARAAPGGRKKHVPGGVLAGPPPNSANGSPVGSPETGNIRKDGCPASNRRSSNVNSNVCGNSKTGGSNSRSSSKVKMLPSGKDRDIEAARQTPETSRATSVAASEFEVRNCVFKHVYRVSPGQKTGGHHVLPSTALLYYYYCTALYCCTVLYCSALLCMCSYCCTRHSTGTTATTVLVGFRVRVWSFNKL